MTSELNRIFCKIQKVCDVKRIRANELFLDYDKLRSGFVTDSQFFRVLWQNLELKYSAEEQEMMLGVLDPSHTKRVNWRAFCDFITQSFVANDLSIDPGIQIRKTTEYFKTSRTLGQSLDARQEQAVEHVLRRVQPYYKYNGIDIRQCYVEFDKHNSGLITESQFRKGFPGPSQVSPDELDMLCSKYRDPSSADLINYMNLYIDLEQLKHAAAAQQEDQQHEADTQRGRGKTECLDKNVLFGDKIDESILTIEEKIRIVVQRYGIRVLEFMRDYDKLRHDAITENQFICSLSLAVGRQANLTKSEIQQLANFYRRPDGFIRYRDFCNRMGNPFTVFNLEKDPLKDPIVPGSGAFSRTELIKSLSPEEEFRVGELLNSMSKTIQTKRMWIYPYFEDYDMSKAKTHLMTPSQFTRVLHFLSLDVSAEDGALLCRRFADPSNGEVNYAEFCAHVDQSFVSQKVKPDLDGSVVENPAKTADWKTLVTPVVKTYGDAVSIDTLIHRIRSLVLQHRIRIKMFFEDFDGLRCGKMTADRFLRCLNSIGLSKLDLHDLTPTQQNTILEHYRDVQDPRMIRYADFIEDIEIVFSKKDLEKDPNYQVPRSELFLTPTPGTVDWDCAVATQTIHPDDVALFECVMTRIAQRIKERRILIKPEFQAFDKLNRGHVTPNNFTQIMNVFGAHLTERENSVVCQRFLDDQGFNYFDFMALVDPQLPFEHSYVTRLVELRQLNSNKAKRAEPFKEELLDAEVILNKIKSLVFRRGIRILNYFVDHDKLRHGEIPRTTFRRALNTTTVLLPETEISVIEDRYAGRKCGHVDYKAFCSDVEAIFQTAHLEKDPLKQHSQFAPDPQHCCVTANNDDAATLATTTAGEQETSESAEEAATAKHALSKLATKVREQRVQLAPLFSDFDRSHRMAVSQSQFRRALMQLDIAAGISELEWQALYRHFRNPLGSRDDVNYLAFADTIYEMGGFAYRVP